MNLFLSKKRIISGLVSLKYEGLRVHCNGQSAMGKVVNVVKFLFLLIEKNYEV